MANKDDYLTEYRQFFEEFANTVEPNDQLPVKLGSYKFLNSEVVGGIIDWCLQYLNRKSCPSTLVGPLIKITIDEIRNGCKKNPLAYGFNPNENVYEPLKLMQTVMSKVNEICLQYLDNSRLDTLPTPPSISPSKVSVCATRNTRRRMEDRHVVIHDMNSMFNIPDTSLASYYAIFDGHAGPDAAAYSAAHLHQFLVESEFYPTDPERALKDAFLRTDEFFLEKSKVESFRSGTTAVCALLRPKEETLYVAWVGDSQALLVNRGKVLQIVKPHKPSREDEKDRIEANGGCVIYWGMWRVNGQLAVSRAIGDLKLKPYVTAEPDIVAVPLDGNEEFLIMACDGLWDFVSEDDAAINVYNRIKKNPENIDSIAESLAELAKQEGSRDNISIIIIFLKDPSKIAKKLSTDWGWPCAKTTDAAMETGVDNQINNASNNFDLFDVFQKRGTLFNDETDFKSNGTEAKQTDLFLFERPANGKRPASEFEDDDLGPETNIDSLENITVDSDKIVEKMAEEIVDNNDKKMDELMDFEVQNQKLGGFETIGEVREETPTPPVDSVLDSSGVADNVAESEESEDEWNYYRVDPKEKESSSPPEETNKDICDPTDEMSQLNPDAKEFVPVSPTRSTESPAPYPRDLVDDTLIAQSPRRAIPMDINVPSAVEFQFEVKQRPSELFDEFKEEQNEHQLSSQEIMQNLLNGKDVSEIEFHPQNVIDSSPDDIIENNLIETDNNKKDISEENQSTTEVTENFIPKIQTQDPMSMSFYQDKDEEATSDSNPFDLNKVQVLPENVDEFIQQTNKIEAEISPAQSPLGVPLAKTPVSESPLPKSDIIEENRSPLGVPLAKTPVSESPLSKPDTIEENRSPLGIPLAKTPVSDSPLPKTDTIEENKSLVEIANSPICDIVESVEKLATPEIIEEILVDVTPKPLEVHSPENSPMGPLSPKSPIPELTGLVSPDITASIKDENISGESPLLEELITEKPAEEVAQNVVQQAVEDLIEQTADLVNQIKDDLQIKDTQVEELISDAIQDIPQTVPEKMSEEIVAATSEFILELNSEPILEQIAPQLSEQICNTSTVSSEVVNEFLERSEIPEVTSPLSPSEEIEKFQTEPPENWKQNLEIQCETIKPEFAVHTIASPSEESTPPPPTPVAISTEPQKIVEAETKTQKVTSKPLSAKKPLTKPSTPIASTAAKKTPIKTTTLKSRTSTTPSASPKTTTATKTTPRVSAITQVNKEATKKLTNGDVKPKTTLIKKTTPNLTATKTVAEKKPATATAARTTTSKLTTTSRPLSATAAPKPRPAPAKITSTSATTKTAPSRPTTIPAARPAPITAKPKPLPSTTVPKPRVASAKTTTKTPDAEKQQKDTVNKQLSASRTTKTTTARTATLAPKKPDVKTSTTTRTTTRTSTTTSKSAIKRPEVTKTTITKTKTTSSKATAEQNGVNIVKEITTTIEEPQLLKDHSPIEVDNSKIEEIIAD